MADLSAPFLVRMTQPEREALSAASDAEERPMSVVLRRALREYLERHHGGSPALSAP